jgi:SAM-dependent methyltransferase
MKLSQIVAFKNYLEEVTPMDTAGVIYDKLGDVLNSVQSRDIQFENLTSLLENNYQSVLKSVNKFEQSLELLKAKLDQTIAQIEPSYYAESSRLYSQEMIHDTPEYILNRRININSAATKFLTSRIQSHSNWKHAGMILRPGREDWINYLVGSDPLFLIDQHSELLEPAILRFNDQYQRRLRTYTISETDNSLILEQLPNQQFAFCLAYNFFNYKPFETIQNYLKEIYKKLKSGGHLLMTFNDCDREGGVKLAERNFMCYTPGQAIFRYASELGFEIQEIFRVDSATTWVEFYRPGVITSLRGGQSLAKVLYKSKEIQYTTEQLEKINDKIDVNEYTAEDLEKIKRLCLDLNINTNEIPTVEQIIEIIKQSIKVVNEVNYTSEELEKIIRMALDLNIKVDDMHITQIVELINQRK